MTSREEALAILDEYIQNENLKRHMYAVEAAIRDYALDYGEDPDLWGIAGLLHDFDWEIHPSLDAHALEGAPILRARGVPEEIIQCILSHVDFTGVPRDTLMAKSILDLSVKSIKKKWKDKRFAAAVDRAEIEKAAEELGVELWDHVDHVLRSMQRIADEIGLGE